MVVLDEIDRAAPAVAQSAITLARRSLDMPGVVVVLSYVDALIRYKAFNPLVDSLPDLGSTMRAVIFDEGPDQAGPGRAGGPLSDQAPDSLRRWEAWTSAEESRLSASRDPAGAATRPDPQATEQDDRRLSEAVRLGYAGASPVRRRLLQLRFAEKYLGSRPIDLHRLGNQDVGAMVVSFGTLRGLVARLVGDGEHLSPETGDLVRSAVADALDIWRERGMATYDAPPIRSLEGELFRRLSSVEPSQMGMEKVSPSFVGAVALASYDTAGLRYARRADSP